MSYGPLQRVRDRGLLAQCRAGACETLTSSRRPFDGGQPKTIYRWSPVRTWRLSAHEPTEFGRISVHVRNEFVLWQIGQTLECHFDPAASLAADIGERARGLLPGFNDVELLGRIECSFALVAALLGIEIDQFGWIAPHLRSLHQ